MYPLFKVSSLKNYHLMHPLNKEAYKLTLKNTLKIKLFLKNLELLICVLNVS